MRRFKIILLMAMFTLGQGFSGYFHAYGELKVEGKRQFNLDLKPLDIVSSLDGERLFILTEGKILIYSVMENRVIDSIPVDKDYDRISLTGRGNALFLSSSSGKRVELIGFQVIQKIDTSGLPFRGPGDAPVTIAVFGDYQ